MRNHWHYGSMSYWMYWINWIIDIYFALIFSVLNEISPFAFQVRPTNGQIKTRHPPTHLSIYPSIPPFIHLLVYLFIYLFRHLPISQGNGFADGCVIKAHIFSTEMRELLCSLFSISHFPDSQILILTYRTCTHTCIHIYILSMIY